MPTHYQEDYYIDDMYGDEPDPKQEPDNCNICGEVLEFSDGEDGKYYIYCPHCGPKPEIIDPKYISGSNVLGYPPAVWSERFLDW